MTGSHQQIEARRRNASQMIEPELCRRHIAIPRIRHEEKNMIRTLDTSQNSGGLEMRAQSSSFLSFSARYLDRLLLEL